MSECRFFHERFYSMRRGWGSSEVRGLGPGAGSIVIVAGAMELALIGEVCTLGKVQYLRLSRLR